MSVAALLLSILSVPVVASDSPEIWERCRVRNSELCDGYLLGTFDAMSRQRLICPDRSLNRRTARRLVRQFVREHPAVATHSFPSVAGQALQAAFPCARPARQPG